MEISFKDWLAVDVPGERGGGEGLDSGAVALQHVTHLVR